MRPRIAEPRRVFSLCLRISLYDKLVDVVGRGNFNTFISQLLEEKLKGEDPKEKLKKRLIEAYKREAESKEFQEEMAIWEGVAGDNINDE